MADLNAIEDHHPLLDGVDRVSIEVRGALFELRKVLNRAKTTFRRVDLLVEDAAKARRIEAKAPILWADVRTQVKLSRGVPVDMAIKAGDPKTDAVGEFYPLHLREDRAAALVCGVEHSAVLTPARP